MMVVIAVIWSFSNQDSDMSVKVSDGVVSAISIQGNQWQGASTIPLIFGLDIRQLVHVLFFAVLGIMSVGFWKKWWRVGLFCYVIEAIDELHQYFVPGRTARFMDTLIDAIGFCTVIFVWMIMRFIRDRSHISVFKNR